jgi:hypothetical protein
MTPVPRDLRPSAGLCDYCTGEGTGRQAGKAQEQNKMGKTKTNNQNKTKPTEYGLAFL